MKHFISIILLLLVSSVSYSATLVSMSKIQIEKDFINKTHTSIGVDNLNGKTVNNSNSIFLDKFGKIYGKMGGKPESQLM